MEFEKTLDNFLRINQKNKMQSNIYSCNIHQEIAVNFGKEIKYKFDVKR